MACLVNVFILLARMKASIPFPHLPTTRVGENSKPQSSFAREGVSDPGVYEKSAAVSMHTYAKHASPLASSLANHLKSRIGLRCTKIASGSTSSAAALADHRNNTLSSWLAHALAMTVPQRLIARRTPIRSTPFESHAIVVCSNRSIFSNPSVLSRKHRVTNVASHRNGCPTARTTRHVSSSIHAKPSRLFSIVETTSESRVRAYGTRAPRISALCVPSDENTRRAGEAFGLHGSSNTKISPNDPNSIARASALAGSLKVIAAACGASLAYTSTCSRPSSSLATTEVHRPHLDNARKAPESPSSLVFARCAIVCSIIVSAFTIVVEPSNRCRNPTYPPPPSARHACANAYSSPPCTGCIASSPLPRDTLMTYASPSRVTHAARSLRAAKTTEITSDGNSKRAVSPKSSNVCASRNARKRSEATRASSDDGSRTTEPL
ncbi:hypothetical protein BE221DRAFT_203038 [Ostreococcus tauri]|uniref:Uncharacterized protein n=1 Tax=Ostreococcus tauri TaxID=70448 RepID=A0A1Y5IP54_OSTTA|nr:hypothetical protein BE221DRAFT_203038 [Ostreococcus tauri]